MISINDLAAKHNVTRRTVLSWCARYDLLVHQPDDAITDDDAEWLPPKPAKTGRPAYGPNAKRIYFVLGASDAEALGKRGGTLHQAAKRIVLGELKRKGGE